VPTVNSKSKVVLGEQYPGLDIRGRGGYINLLGTNGTGSYTWLTDDRTPYDPAIIPDEQIELIVKRERPRKQCKATVFRPRSSIHANLGDDAIASLVKEALDRSEHGRNDAGFWLACQLRDAGMPEDRAEEVMSAYCDLAPETDHRVCCTDW